MATKINARLRHKRGTEGSIPTLVDGQIYLCTDTHRIYKGTSTGENILISDINKLNTIYNDNLLINGDFQVWQRGTHFENVGAGQYQADRWRVLTTDGNYLATVDKVVEGLKISQDTAEGAGCVMQYRFEDSDFKRINGKVCTLSKSINGAIETTQITPTSNMIEIAIGGNVTVNWIKLELGTVATPFVPRPYAEELALCQRYYEKIGENTYNLSRVSALENYILGVEYMVTKRIAPTVTIFDESGIAGQVSNLTVSEEKLTDAHASVVNTYGFRQIAVQGAKLGNWYSFSYEADAEIY